MNPFRLSFPATTHRWIPAALCLFAVIVYALFMSVLPERWKGIRSGDYFRYYHPVAQNLVLGHGFVQTDGKPAVTYPPGFPLMLAAVAQLSALTGAGEARTWEVIDMGLYLGVVLLIYAIAAEGFGQAVGCLAALLWSTYPFQLWLLGRPDTTNP